MQYVDVGKMTTPAIEHELHDFPWEYIALSDRAQTDEAYKDGEEKLDARKRVLAEELERRQASGLSLTRSARRGNGARL